MLELAIQLGDQRHVILRLKTETTARAHQWPDAKAANLAMLFVWALIQEKRRRKGMAFAVLEPARKNAVDAPIKIERRLRAKSIGELVAEIQKPVMADFVSRGETSLHAVTHISAFAMVRSMLDLDPMTLRYYRTDEELAVSAKDPEELARAGLDLLLRDALRQYEIMRERHTTVVRLMSDDDAKDARIPGAPPSRIATLLAAVLHADAQHEVIFRAPRARPAEEKTMLWETAKAVYLDYSDEAQEGFELLCDGCVHFGHGNEWTIADKLLYEVARDCDPDLQRMPYCVSVQVAISALTETGYSGCDTTT